MAVNPDSGEDLFHHIIHPVLDLCRVSIHKDLSVNEEALNDYLRMMLAEYKEQILHDAIKRQRAWLTDQGYDSSCVCGGCGWCVVQECGNLIHPGCDECVEE